MRTETANFQRTVSRGSWKTKTAFELGPNVPVPALTKGSMLYLIGRLIVSALIQ
jgi:hypothetical protein